MSDVAFDRFRALTHELCGIQLDATRRMMLSSRLVRRVRELQLDGFDAYLAHMEVAGTEERARFVDAVTTNLSYFFRETHHFDWLASVLFPRLCLQRESHPVRIWSAGCSAGQEPYSLAITAHDSGLVQRRDVRILATDVHSGLVAQVARGSYREAELRGLTDAQRGRWMHRDGEDHYLVDAALRELIIVRQLNLFDAWPVRRGVDVIVCRNVLIYFDEPSRQRVLAGFGALQRPGDHLLLGHSETIRGAESLYDRVDNTVYVRR